MCAQCSYRSAFACRYNITDFDKPVSSAPLTIDAVTPCLSAQAMGMYIDLAPYVNPPSYMVQASTCAAQVYNLFTSLGLRHLCVVPDTRAVLGVVTRKDLMAAHARGVISNKVWTTTEDGDPRATTAASLGLGGLEAVAPHNGHRRRDNGLGATGEEMTTSEAGQRGTELPTRVGVVRVKQKPAR